MLSDVWSNETKAYNANNTTGQTSLFTLASLDSPDEQHFKEVVNLLSVRDAGERRILPADEYASVPHHDQQEACLTVRGRTM